MSKNILIISSNFYAFKSIFHEILNFFKPTYNIYYISNNLYASKKDNIFFENMVQKKKIKFFMMFKNYYDNSNHRNNDTIIVNDLNIIVKSLKNVFFDEILISETILPETKYLLKRLKHNKTILSFLYPHGLDRDVLYEYQSLKSNQNFRVNFIDIVKYYFYSGNYYEKVKSYLKKSLTNIYYYKNTLESKSFFIGKKIKFHPIFDSKQVSKIYFFDKLTEEILKTVFGNNFTFQMISDEQCICNKKPRKDYSLILLPIFKKNTDIENRQNQFLNFIKNNLDFLENHNSNFVSYIIKKHPRDKSNFENKFIDFLRSLTSKKIFVFEDINNSGNEINFCDLEFILGTGTLISMASRRCKKINIYTSKKLNEIDNGFKILNEIYSYQYINKESGSKINFI